MTYAPHNTIGQPFGLTTIPDPSRSLAYYNGVPTKRALAWVIDSLAIAGLSLIALPFTAFTGLLFFPFLMMVVGFLYRWFSLSVLSATPGMRMVGVVLHEGWGQRLGPDTAFWHTAAYTGCVIMAPLQLISVFFMATTPRGRGLHDMALNTVAINAKTAR